jgi:hypothetical protein
VAEITLLQIDQDCSSTYFFKSLLSIHFIQDFRLKFYTNSFVTTETSRCNTVKASLVLTVQRSMLFSLSHLHSFLKSTFLNSYII